MLTNLDYCNSLYYGINNLLVYITYNSHKNCSVRLIHNKKCMNALPSYSLSCINYPSSIKFFITFLFLLLNPVTTCTKHAVYLLSFALGSLLAFLCSSSIRLEITRNDVKIGDCAFSTRTSKFCNQLPVTL